MKNFSHTRRLLMIPLFIAVAFLIFLVTMLLWNNLMPNIFSLPQITYWQAAGLLILGRLLFGFGGHMRRSHSFRSNMLKEKWDKMSPEEREKFRFNLRHGHHYCYDQGDADKAGGSQANKQ